MVNIYGINSTLKLGGNKEFRIYDLRFMIDDLGCGGNN
jgi:hypothetical protein